MPFLRRHAALLFMILGMVTSLVSLLHQSHSGHYDFFSASALKIWRSQNPYGIGYPSGFFNYSPSCALVFYSLFAFFPYRLGLALYMVTSCALLIWGIIRFLRRYPCGAWARNVFLVLGTSEVIGTVLNARIEIFILAIHFVAASLIMGRRRLALAYFLLAMVCNWKMQSLPVLGLLLLIEVLCFRDWRPILYSVLSLGFWYGLPFLLKPAPFVLDCYRVWKEYLDLLVRRDWSDFQHVYRFLKQVFGVAIPWGMAQGISAAVGALLAARLGYAIYRAPRAAPAEFVLWAIAAGGAYTSAFSPASQSAAYVLYIPALLWIMAARGRIASAATKNFALGGVLLSWFLISACYSDLVPRHFRILCFESAVKAGGMSLILIQLLILPFAIGSEA